MQIAAPSEQWEAAAFIVHLTVGKGEHGNRRGRGVDISALLKVLMYHIEAYDPIVEQVHGHPSIIQFDSSSIRTNLHLPGPQVLH